MDRHPLAPLLPPRCVHCGGAALQNGAWARLLCVGCRGRCAPPRPVEGIRGIEVVALHVYRGPTRSLVRELKYRGLVSVAGGFADGMARLSQEHAPEAGIVVPVPLHWSRRWRRGHDQAAALARGVCRRVDRFRLLRALQRTRRTAPQVGRGPAARRRNVVGAFRIRKRAVPAVREAELLLVDDVVTTGATLLAAAAALRSAGAGRVVALTAAISPVAPRSECR